MVAGERPRSAPALVMPWYRHAAAPWTSPRVLTARDGSELVGVPPMTLFNRRLNLARYEITGSAVLNAVEPAGAPVGTVEVAGAFARALRRTSRRNRIRRVPWLRGVRPRHRRPRLQVRIADREVTLDLVGLERRGLWPLQSPFQLVPLERRPALIAGVDQCLTQVRSLLKRTESGGPG